ncbi:hypothetical protein E4665_12230 [Sporolactobacillus shoreae]|uniref:Uncharacterized protein n=1 Tax=Sporolactobacillus shoreae TaxID=1465501 RepID=A0A4Z0GLR6_9BACL|nr:hypothetical protein [Sporolactobacillus shoreae]TGA97388.1 hypothetical protein E4665_12230 [Sporolactobacillus shoreae]
MDQEHGFIIFGYIVLAAAIAAKSVWVIVRWSGADHKDRVKLFVNHIIGLLISLITLAVLTYSIFWRN